MDRCWCSYGVSGWLCWLILALAGLLDDWSLERHTDAKLGKRRYGVRQQGKGVGTRFSMAMQSCGSGSPHANVRSDLEVVFLAWTNL